MNDLEQVEVVNKKNKDSLICLLSRESFLCLSRKIPIKKEEKKKESKKYE